MSDMALGVAANAKEMCGIQQLGPRLNPIGLQAVFQFGCTLAPIPSDPQPKGLSIHFAGAGKFYSLPGQSALHVVH